MPGDSRGVFVLGAHRSGTSAVTRLLNALGLDLGTDSDLTPAGEGNPAGHWESSSLTRRNEQLLHLVGSAWDCPPPVSEQIGTALIGQVRPGPARAAFSQVYDSDRWVWKDPRLALLLPFWRSVLPGSHAAVLVVRQPRDVAESLAARNGLAIRHGLAIWERYLRAGLVSCLGLPTVVVDHAALLADPVGAATDLSRFLADDVAPSDAVATAAATIDPDLRHHAAAGTDEVSDEQLALWQQLRQLVGAHPRLATAPAGAETPGLDAYLAPRRSFWGWSPSARLSADPVLGLVAAYSAEGA